LKDYFLNKIVDDLDEQGRVKVAGHEWQNSAVFENMDPVAFEEHVNAALTERVTLAKERAAAFLEQTGSRENFELLCERVQRNVVMPFVGAGMSISSGFPLWGDFLLRLSDDDANLKSRVQQHLENSRFEDAAQEVADAIGDEAFTNDIHAHLGRSRRDPDGPVQLLPMVFRRGCITTNLDEVLERVYRAQNAVFSSEPCGEQLKNLQGFINPDDNVLFKLHGTAVHPNGRILTRNEYQRAYGNDIALSDLLTRLTGNKHLLFLGCSLSADRTLQALTEINQTAGVNTPSHSAFLPLSENTDRLGRRQQLNAANIHPIWYPHEPGEDHDQPIEDLLVCMIEGGLDD
jgi:hypothetical protein